MLLPFKSTILFLGKCTFYTRFRIFVYFHVVVSLLFLVCFWPIKMKKFFIFFFFRNAFTSWEVFVYIFRVEKVISNNKKFHLLPKTSFSGHSFVLFLQKRKFKIFKTRTSETKHVLQKPETKLNKPNCMFWCVFFYILSDNTASPSFPKRNFPHRKHQFFSLWL